MQNLSYNPNFNRFSVLSDLIEDYNSDSDSPTSSPTWDVSIFNIPRNAATLYCPKELSDPGVYDADAKCLAPESPSKVQSSEVGQHSQDITPLYLVSTGFCHCFDAATGEDIALWEEDTNLSSGFSSDSDSDDDDDDFSDTSADDCSYYSFTYETDQSTESIDSNAPDMVPFPEADYFVTDIFAPIDNSDSHDEPAYPDSELEDPDNEHHFYTRSSTSFSTLQTARTANKRPSPLILSNVEKLGIYSLVNPEDESNETCRDSDQEDLTEVFYTPLQSPKKAAFTCADISGGLKSILTSGEVRTPSSKRVRFEPSASIGSVRQKDEAQAWFSQIEDAGQGAVISSYNHDDYDADIDDIIDQIERATISYEMSLEKRARINDAFSSVNMEMTALLVAAVFAFMIL
ncbi:hypothetical protein CVT24_012908 [Panaeolus cyanescens]|uniref:Uncharacterized protein n=1 Tax=Panaeolus cyanescens TaxID=181874 RepID=A0A409W2Q2_9AGAR|nr:hypothetical protein CVT24_012908 [Panaeolus cyanescens]